MIWGNYLPTQNAILRHLLLGRFFQVVRDSVGEVLRGRGLESLLDCTSECSPIRSRVFAIRLAQADCLQAVFATRELSEELKCKPI